MNRRKKLRFILIVYLIFVDHTTQSATIGSVLQLNLVPAAKENINDVEYFAQKTPYFCGQASAQMVLNMITGKRPSQFRLEKEVNFIENAGTRNIQMKNPFKNRNIKIIRDGVFSNQNQLRKAIDHNQVSIINIRFDIEANSGHYVVVTGYNETGFFVNDPWPEEWGKPVDRDTGENAYISNSMLRELWVFRLNWVLILAGPNSINELNVAVEVQE